MNVSILMSEEEQKLAEGYAQNHNLTLEEAFKSALLESFQDEYGIERYYINNQEVPQGEYEKLKNKVFAEE
jgi:hypothetical protein